MSVMSAPEPTVGTEVEYPRAQPENSHTTFTDAATSSYTVRDEVQDDYVHGPHTWAGAETIGSDPTVGLEIASEPMSPDSLANWYRETIEELKSYAPFEPCGILQGNGTSAGLHLHMSPFDRDTMQALYQMSIKPWFQVFTCTSIAERPQPTYRLFRNLYCPMTFGDIEGSSNDCVTLRDGYNDHWEWRLLEPVTPDHFELVMEFVKKLKQDPVVAADFARGLVESGDDRLTAIKRAKEVNIVEKVKEIPDENQFDVARGFGPVGRSSVQADVDFYELVRSESHAPYIYSVRNEETDEGYYAMHTLNYDSSDDPFVVDGCEFNHDSVLFADTLESVPESEAHEIRQAVDQYYDNNNSSTETQKSEATDELVKILGDDS